PGRPDRRPGGRRGGAGPADAAGGRRSPAGARGARRPAVRPPPAAPPAARRALGRPPRHGAGRLPRVGPRAGGRGRGRLDAFRRHPTAAIALAVGGLALCRVVVAVRLGWFRPAPSLPDEQRVAATATITPRSHYFADMVTARLELLFRRDRVPPSSVKVTAPF